MEGELLLLRIGVAAVHRYFVNCEPTNDVNRVAYDREVGKKLWDLSVKLTSTAPPPTRKPH